VAGWTLVLGYVYGDARRRGMRYGLWTLLAVFIPNGIGVVLYFILREPMPSYCAKCGSPAKQGHAFCPIVKGQSPDAGGTACATTTRPQFRR